MVNYAPLLEEIDETRRQIKLTDSKQRKYQLNRRLHRLKKEYFTAKMYEAEARKRK